MFVLLSESPSIGRTEIANASEILDRYLKKKCYDKRTRPNVTGIYFREIRDVIKLPTMLYNYDVIKLLEVGTGEILVAFSFLAKMMAQ